MARLTAKSCWNVGDKVSGVYCLSKFNGTLDERCRPTPDGRNVIFGVTLDAPIDAFGQERTTIEVWSNSLIDEING